MNIEPALQRAHDWGLLISRWISGHDVTHARWLAADDLSWTWGGPLSLGVALPHGWPTVLVRTTEPAAARADENVIAATNGLVRAHALPIDTLTAPSGTRALICSAGVHTFTLAFAPDALTHLPPTRSGALTVTLGPAPDSTDEDQYRALPDPCPVIVELQDGTCWHALLQMSATTPILHCQQRADGPLDIRFQAMAEGMNEALLFPIELATRGTVSGSGLKAAWMRSPIDPAQWAIAVLQPGDRRVTDTEPDIPQD